MIGFLINFFLAFFCWSATFLGVRQYAYAGSIILLAIISLVFTAIAIKLFFVYINCFKNKEESNDKNSTLH